MYHRTRIRTIIILTVSILASIVHAHPTDASSVDLETGFLAAVRHNTPFRYRLIPTQLSWRSPTFRAREFSDGSRLVVRHRLTLLGTWVRNGPESHYVGVAGSPSVEWWNPAGTHAVFAGAGGGFGWIDSRGIPGGQGQDLTLNWFARTGLEHVMGKGRRILLGLMFQHLSNGGMTKPNPGIDVLGVTCGFSWSL